MLLKIITTLRYVFNHPVCSSARFRSVITYCLKQVGARLLKEEVCVGLIGGTRLLLSPRAKGESQFIYPPLGEFADMGFVLHFLRADELFADVGANVGVYTILASGVTGAKTISFEPSPATFARLVSNVRLNEIESKVVANNVAVGRAAGNVEFTEGRGTENCVASGEFCGPRTKVPVVTLDEIFSSTPPKLIKVDAEGFETEVFAGASRLLSNLGLRALIVERGGNSSRYGYDESALHGHIMECGFLPFQYEPFGRSFTPVSAEFVGNIIYLRDLNEAKALVGSAPVFTVGQVRF